MMQTVALVSDPSTLQVLTEFCHQLDFLTLHRAFSHPAEALKHLRREPADFVLLDLSPAATAWELHRALPAETGVIYTSAVAEHALEAYNLGAVDYLLQPFSFARFEQAARKAWQLHECRQRLAAEARFVHLRAGYHWQKVVVADICYVEAVGDYVRLHLDSGKPLLVRLSLKALLALLPAHEFMQVHRSFVVPVRRLTSVHRRRLLVGEVELPVGATYVARLHERMGQKN
jgi:DNA-binding LytR/AlgR family response regulator